MKSFAKNKPYTIQKWLYDSPFSKDSLRRVFREGSINFSIEIWNNPRVIFYFYKMNKPLKKYAE